MESLSKLVSLYQPPWPISPLQPGSFLHFSDSQLCRLHGNLMNLPLPAEDFCAQLPWSLVGNRPYNLPRSRGYLFRSKRVAGLGYCKRGIEGVAAFWSPYESVVVADEDVDDRMMGVLTRYRLVFGDISDEESRREEGIWRADEYTYGNDDGECSIVVLYCDNRTIEVLEKHLGFADEELLLWFGKNLKRQVEGIEEQALSYLDIIGACFAQISVEKRRCREKEERLGSGNFDGEGSSIVALEDVNNFFDIDALAVHDENRKIPLGRMSQGGARVRAQKKEARGKRKRHM